MATLAPSAPSDTIARDRSQISLIGDTGSMRLLSIESAAAPGDGKRPVRKWKALAYTGAVVNQWFGRVVIDLAGMRPLNLAQSPIPLLMNHGWAFDDESPRLGAIGALMTSKDGIELSGHFLSNDKVDGVVQDLDQGFPFQFSIGVESHRTEQIQAGQKLAVNGREVVGPCEVVREWSLREGSVVALGADMDTRTVALAAMTRALKDQNPRSIAMADAAVADKAAEQIAKDAAETAAQADLEDDAAAKPVSGNAGAALSAGSTITQLRAALGGDKADPALVLLCAEQGLSPEQAKAVLAFADARSKAAPGGAALSDARPAGAALGGGPAANPGHVNSGDGKAGAVAFSGALGKDPATDWGNSEALRSKCTSLGMSKDVFLRFCEGEKKAGINYLDAMASI